MTERRFSYTYRGNVSATSQEELSGENMQTLLAIRDTLKALTGACEVCQFNLSSMCQKHGHQIKEGDSRCPDFARRLSQSPGEGPERQVERYVFEILGARGPTFDRLTGKKARR